jgi:hypothetical protein
VLTAKIGEWEEVKPEEDFFTVFKHTETEDEKKA